jgi:hypothetical protein
MGKKLSGAAKRKKKKEKEEAIERARADFERLKLGPTALWTGLVLHHKDIFVSHVLPKLNTADRVFFAEVNSESKDLLKYAGVNASEMSWFVHECSSISTLELVWYHIKDQTWFCVQMVRTNRLELLKWAREVKKCDWDKWTINMAAGEGNLEMLEYCFANGCPRDEENSCCNAAGRGHLDCLRFLFNNKVKPSRETETNAAIVAAQYGHIDILKYFVEERKISDVTKDECVLQSVFSNRLDCIKYLVDEAKAPLNDLRLISAARFVERYECENFLLEKGCPEPTDEENAEFVEVFKRAESRVQSCRR